MQHLLPNNTHIVFGIKIYGNYSSPPMFSTVKVLRLV